MFPAVVNCCTIDWFSEWPAEALLEVARKLLKKDEIGDPDLTENICKMCVTAHQVCDRGGRNVARRGGWRQGELSGLRHEKI